jgi:hypothetical protein
VIDLQHLAGGYREKYQRTIANLDLFIDLGTRHGIKVAFSKFDLHFPPIDCPHSGKLSDNGCVLSVAIRIGRLGLFECTVKSPHLVFESKSLYSKIVS